MPKSKKTKLREERKAVMEEINALTFAVKKDDVNTYVECLASFEDVKAEVRRTISGHISALVYKRSFLDREIKEL